jgi:hypothetical protein
MRVITDMEANREAFNDYVKNLFNQIPSRTVSDKGIWTRLLQLEISCRQRLSIAIHFPPASEQIAAVPIGGIAGTGGLAVDPATGDLVGDATSLTTDEQKRHFASFRSDAIVVFSTTPCRIGPNKIQLPGLQPLETHSEILFILEKNKGAATTLLNEVILGQLSGLAPIVAEVGPYWTTYFQAAGFSKVQPTSIVDTQGVAYFVKRPEVPGSEVKTVSPGPDPLAFDTSNSAAINTLALQQGIVPLNNSSSLVPSPTVFAITLASNVDANRYATTAAQTLQQAQQVFDVDVNAMVAAFRSPENVNARLTNLDQIANLQRIHKLMADYARANPSTQNYASVGTIEGELKRFGVQLVSPLTTDVERVVANTSVPPDDLTRERLRAYLQASNGGSDPVALSKFLQGEAQLWPNANPNNVAISRSFVWSNATRAEDFKTLSLTNMAEATNLHSRIVNLRNTWKAQLVAQNAARGASISPAILTSGPSPQDLAIQQIRATSTEFETSFRAKITEFKRSLPQTANTERELLTQWMQESVSNDNNASLWPIVAGSGSVSTAVVPDGSNNNVAQLALAGSPSSISNALLVQQQQAQFFPPVAAATQDEAQRFMTELEQKRREIEEAEKKKDDTLKQELLPKIAASYANVVKKHQAVDEIVKYLQAVGELDMNKAAVSQEAMCYAKAVNASSDSQKPEQTGANLNLIFQTLELNNSCLDSWVQLFQLEQQKAKRKFDLTQQRDIEAKLALVRAYAETATKAIADATSVANSVPGDVWKAQLQTMAQRKVNILNIAQQLANLQQTAMQQQQQQTVVNTTVNTLAANALLDQADTKANEAKSELEELVKMMFTITESNKNDISSILLAHQLQQSQKVVTSGQKDVDATADLLAAQQASLALARRAQAELLRRGQATVSPYRSITATSDALQEAEDALIERKRIEFKLVLAQLATSLNERNMYQDLNGVLANLTRWENDLAYMRGKTTKFDDLFLEAAALRASAQTLIAQGGRQQPVNLLMYTPPVLVYAPPVLKKYTPPPLAPEMEEEEEEEEEPEEEEEGEEGDEGDSAKEDLQDSIVALREVIDSQTKDASHLKTLINDVKEARDAIGDVSPAADKVIREGQALYAKLKR